MTGNEPHAGDAGRDAERQLLEEIEQSLSEINLGFDFKVLDVLDDERATPARIEALKDQLGPVVSACLFSIANSVYYGKLRSGNITRFVDVVKHLGTDTTKTTAIFVALLALAETEDLRLVFARSFATSKLAEALAVRLGLRGVERSAVTLGGLFVEIGRIMIMLFAQNRQRCIEEDFITRHQPYIGTKVIDRFELPVALKRIIDHPYFTFEKKDGLALSAIVDLGYGVAARSFAEFGKLVVESAMPDREGLLYSSTIGSLLAGQFQILGLGSYVQVVAAELSEQERRICERRGDGAV